MGPVDRAALSELRNSVQDLSKIKELGSKKDDTMLLAAVVKNAILVEMLGVLYEIRDAVSQNQNTRARPDPV